MSTLFSILLTLALLAPALISLAGGSAMPGLGWSLLLAPILHAAGSRLRALEDPALLGPVAVPAAAQALLGTFLLGGAAHALIPREATGLSGALTSALLWGAVLSVGEAGLAAGRSLLPTSRFRLPTFVEGHSALSFVVVVVVISLLLRGPVSGLLELGLGFAMGAGAGLAGSLASRVFLSPIPAALLALCVAEGASLAAAGIHGSATLAAVVSGLLGAIPAAGRASWPSPSRSSAIGGRGREEAPGAFDWIVLLAAAGLLFRAGESLDFAGALAYLPGGAALWGGAVALRFLVHFGFGGLYRWRHPRELPLRWLSAFAWGSYPGAAAAGLLFLWMEQSEGRGVPVPLYAPLWAIALALLFQGTTSAAVLSRASRGEVPGEVRDRWSRLRALAIALRAERRAIAEIARQGGLDDDALSSMEDAVAGGERRIEAELSEIHGAESALRSEELSAAVRAVLAAGREAVAEARERGWIAAGPAAEVERELERRWSRSGTASLHELLSGLDAPPSRGPVRDPVARPAPAPGSPAPGPEGGGQVHGPG